MLDSKGAYLSLVRCLDKFVKEERINVIAELCVFIMILKIRLKQVN